jgi:hypothetical protein
MDKIPVLTTLAYNRRLHYVTGFNKPKLIKKHVHFEMAQTLLECYMKRVCVCAYMCSVHVVDTDLYFSRIAGEYCL